MAQVWKCLDCGYMTQDPKEAGDHERVYNWGHMCDRNHHNHFMEDLGE